MDEKIITHIINYISENPGITDNNLKANITNNFSITESDRLKYLSLLINSKYLKVDKIDGNLVYNIISPESNQAISNLNKIEAQIYKYIEASGNKGKFKKEIKNQLNISIPMLNKILKNLEKVGLILPYKTKENNAIIYLPSNKSPEENIIGNGFYKEGKLDQDYFNKFKDTIIKIISKHIKMEFSEIIDYLSKEKNFEYLDKNEVKIALNIMILDETLELVENFTKKIYKISNFNNYIQKNNVPCFSCLYFDDCTIKGTISPINCNLYDSW